MNSEQTVGTTLDRIGTLAVLGIDGCDAAGVSFSEEGCPSRKVFTNELAELADADEQSSDEGPDMCPD